MSRGLPSPAPERFQVLSFPTPSLDLFFWEKVDLRLPRVRDDAVIGAPHPDTERYPEHKLVHRQPMDASGFHQFFYAAPREHQDVYNWEYSQADIGGVKFNSVVRTYVSARASYTPLNPLQGAAMPNVPQDMFTGSYVLAGREEKRIESELDGLFVSERLTYVQKATITDINMNPTFGCGVGTTTTLYFRGESTSGGAIESIVAVPSNAFWGLQTDGTVRSGRQLTANWFAVIVESSLDAYLLTYRRTKAGFTDVSLPDVLTGITVQWNEADSTGNQTTQSGFYGEWADEIRANGSLGDSVRADASASVQPEFYFDIQSPDGRGVKCTHHTFYLKKDDVTHADVLAVTGGSLWPKFNPVAHNIAWKGQKVSVSAQSSASGSLSCTESADGHISKDLTETTGASFDVGTMSGSIRIPPTIHGVINIAVPTKIKTASATAHVSWPVFGSATYLGETVKIPETTLPATTATKIAYAAIDPTSLAATTPRSTIPNTGTYLMEDLRIQESQFPDWMIVTATTINAADLP